MGDGIIEEEVKESRTTLTPTVVAATEPVDDGFGEP